MHYCSINSSKKLLYFGSVCPLLLFFFCITNSTSEFYSSFRSKHTCFEDYLLSFSVGFFLFCFLIFLLTLSGRGISFCLGIINYSSGGSKNAPHLSTGSLSFDDSISDSFRERTTGLITGLFLLSSLRLLILLVLIDFLSDLFDDESV